MVYLNHHKCYTTTSAKPPQVLQMINLLWLSGTLEIFDLRAYQTSSTIDGVL